MLLRVLSIAMNTYREAVRARVLLGLLAFALATSAYSIVIAAMSIRGEMRIVADIGAASISLLSVLVATILGATSLYRELELKTVFPILTRRLLRSEYLVGKYLGILATMLVFVAVDAAWVLTILALQTRNHVGLTVGVGACMIALLGVLLWRAKLTRVFVILPWSVALFIAMALLANGTGGERQIVILSAVLTLAEVTIVAAVAMLFSSFSSPFLTAIFTVMMFAVGRSADTLGNIPARTFGAMGPMIRNVGSALARIVPNLNLYVPARPLLLGEIAAVAPGTYVARAWLNAVLYASVLLTLGALIFRRRDFQ